jgi:DNA-binding NtrC family response regulator
MITKLRILCVEDDLALQGTLRMFLGVYNDFAGALCLSEAQVYLNAPHKPYDVVILDKRLPDGLGFDLIPDIRRHSNGAAVIILTGDQDLTVVTKCLEVGADDYAVKSETLIPELMIRIPVARKTALMRSQLQSGSMSQEPLPRNIAEISPEGLKRHVGQAERAYISTALELVNWDYQEAINALGLARSTLFKKIADLGIQKPKARTDKTTSHDHWEPRL